MKLHGSILISLLMIFPAQAMQKSQRQNSSCLQLCKAAILTIPLLFSTQAQDIPTSNNDNACYKVRGWEFNGRELDVSMPLCAAQDPHLVRSRLQSFVPGLVKDIEITETPCEENCLDSVAAIQTHHLKKSRSKQ